MRFYGIFYVLDKCCFQQNGAQIKKGRYEKISKESSQKAILPDSSLQDFQSFLHSQKYICHILVKLFSMRKTDPEVAYIALFASNDSEGTVCAARKRTSVAVSSL